MIAVIYTSLGGNTEDAAEMIAEEIRKEGVACRVYPAGDFPVSVESFDMVVFGSYTWGDGDLPLVMRRELQRILKVEVQNIKKAAVFGTGDTAFPLFCRASDELLYHLTKHGVPVIGDALKIEQSPYSLGQPKKVKRWVKQILNGGINDEYEQTYTKD